jgi:hypothetical protein
LLDLLQVRQQVVHLQAVDLGQHQLLQPGHGRQRRESFGSVPQNTQQLGAGGSEHPGRFADSSDGLEVVIALDSLRALVDWMASRLEVKLQGGIECPTTRTQPLLPPALEDAVTAADTDLDADARPTDTVESAASTLDHCGQFIVEGSQRNGGLQ